MSQHGDHRTPPGFLPPPADPGEQGRPGNPGGPSEPHRPDRRPEPSTPAGPNAPGEQNDPGGPGVPGGPGERGGQGELPVEPAPPAVFGAPARVLNTATVVAGCVLMVSAFLPWVSGTEVISGFGQVIHRGLGTASGVDVDGTGQLVPVLALMAIGMCLWGVFARNPRICTLAAVPGGLALLSCVIFLVRLGAAQDDLASEGADGLGYEINLSYGWFVALATSLLVIGASLAAPLIARAHRDPQS